MTATTAKKAATKRPATKPQSKPPQMVRVIGVAPEVMAQTLELLQNELPMAKARAVVLALEQSPVVTIPGK